MTEPGRRQWGFIALGALALILFLWVIFGPKKPAEPPHRPPVAVTTAKVVVQDIPVSITALGAAQAWQGVTIRPQVTGVLVRVAFREGSDVRAGQLLAEIDSAPYRAVLMQAQGALRRDSALLKAARADLARYRQLAAQDSISRQQVDTQAALVEQHEGLVQIDQGAVAAARVNLNYCRIVSPVSGRVGVRLIDPGNRVSSSDATGIAIVNQITPIAVTFTVPQGDFQRLSDVSEGFRRALETTALSQETGKELGSGELTVADNHVDPATGTVQLKARFANRGQTLWPGQFVNVRLTLQSLKQAVTVPAAAINQGPDGPFVYVVGPAGRALLRPVAVQMTQDATAVIRSGLTPGETVVTDGQMTLKPGMAVMVGGQAGPGKHHSK